MKNGDVYLGRANIKQQGWMIEQAIIVTLLIAVLSLICVTLTTAQGVRYYAGYTFYGYEGTSPPYGVSARIYTINKNVPTGHFYAQWPTIILSYVYGFWVQVGYTKGWDTNYQLTWYAEKNDWNGWEIHWIGTPSVGATYNYWIERYENSDVWVGGVSGYWIWDFGTLNPNTAVDYQAFSETTTTGINIDGTRFSNLCILSYNGIDWIPWFRHVPKHDPPYWLTQVSDCEFYAWGGG
ncbi:MAG: hypothetical protein ACPL4E_09630 [Thermoproteota archaeon]